MLDSSLERLLMCCRDDFDKLLIREVNLVSCLEVLDYPFGFIMKLMLPIMFWTKGCKLEGF